MKFIVGKFAGFCFGVKRAVKITEDVLKKNKNVYSLGPIIHNKWVVNNLSVQGLQTVNSLSARKRPDTVILPSHGVDPRKIKQFKGVVFVDTTCPFVTKAQNFIKALDENGYEILILGDKNHTEVKGFVSIANKKAKVFENIEQIKRYKLYKKKVALLSQTTQSPKVFKDMCRVLIDKDCDEIRFINTICKDADHRQKEAIKITKASDIVIVIGGKHSANTKRLVKVCANLKKTYHIEEEKEIKKAWLKKVSKVGIVTGASTPGEFVARIKKQIKSLSGC